MLLLYSRPLRAREDLCNIYPNWWDDYRRFHEAIITYCFYKVQELLRNRYYTSRSGILISHLDRYSSRCRYRSQGHYSRYNRTGYSYLSYLGHFDSYNHFNLSDSRSRQVRSRIFFLNLVKLSHDLSIFGFSYFGTVLRHIQCVAQGRLLTI